MECDRERMKGDELEMAVHARNGAKKGRNEEVARGGNGMASGEVSLLFVW